MHLSRQKNIKIMRIKTIATFAALTFFSLASSNAQFTIKDAFADLAECDTMTRGIFIVWWDKDYNYGAQASVLLDTMLSYRNICLDYLKMEDPPNPIDGYYYNVYLHGGGYFSAFGWGNGQGTDVNGYPFLTLPAGLINDWHNTAHETFHVFQYNANAPGFAYAGDSQWYIEASANWFAAIQNPNTPRRFVEAESLVRMPHVPFWLSYGNYPNTYPSNWQRYVHQYALALHLYYLTDVAGISDTIITSGLYSYTNENPQEYMFNTIGGNAFRQHFIDWAAHMTNDFDFIPAYQAQTNLNEWNSYADPDDDNEFIAIFENEGTQGWLRPANDKVTNAWSFNTYKLINTDTKKYTFELKGDAYGSYADTSYFQGKILVQNSTTGAAFFDLNMSSNTAGALSLDLTPQDTAIYFIVASMPGVFRDPNPTFQLFSYEINITAEDVTAIQDPNPKKQRQEIMRVNLLGQKISKEEYGLHFILYNDGTSEKIYRGN